MSPYRTQTERECVVVEGARTEARRITRERPSEWWAYLATFESEIVWRLSEGHGLFEQLRQTSWGSR